MAKDEVYVRPENQPKEQQAARFKEAAARRVNKALTVMDSIKRLATPGYHYTQAQADKIANALHAGVDELHAALLNPETAETGPGFKL